MYLEYRGKDTAPHSHCLPPLFHNCPGLRDRGQAVCVACVALVCASWRYLQSESERKEVCAKGAILRLKKKYFYSYTHIHAHMCVCAYTHVSTGACGGQKTEFPGTTGHGCWGTELGS